MEGMLKVVQMTLVKLYSSLGAFMGEVAISDSFTNIFLHLGLFNASVDSFLF